MISNLKLPWLRPTQKGAPSPGQHCVRHGLTGALRFRMGQELKCEELAVKDLEFRVPFKVEAVRPGTCHGLITHFDTYFENRCDMPIIFTTSAEAELKVQTHWKQTTFYLKGGGVAMQKGDVIEGEFHVARAAHNPRHMDIVVSWAFRPVAGSRGEEVFQNFQLH